MKGLIVLLALCTFSAAMVPLERKELPEATSPVTKKLAICAPPTPCAWTIYKEKSRMTELHIVNSYCVCGAGTVCDVAEDDTTSNALISRCTETSSEKEES